MAVKTVDLGNDMIGVPITSIEDARPIIKALPEAHQSAAYLTERDDASLLAVPAAARAATLSALGTLPSLRLALRRSEMRASTVSIRQRARAAGTLSGLEAAVGALDADLQDAWTYSAEHARLDPLWVALAASLGDTQIDGLFT